MGENINNQNNSVGDKAKPQSEVSPELLAARKAENLKLHKSARVVPVNRQGSSTGSSSGEAVPVAKDTDEKAAGRKHMPPPLPQSGAISAGVGADTVGVSAEEVKKARPSQVQSGHPAGGEGGKQAKKSGATDSAGDADKINPWLSWRSWLRLLWGCFKAVVLFTVISISISFGAIMGVTIYRTYFAIPDEVEVPAITGKDLNKANEMLKKRGLRLRLEEGRHTTKFPNRIIISQEPVGGKTVRKDREVLAVVSLGPDQYRVPNLKGYSLREVKKALSNNKLALGKVSYVTKDSNRPDEVLEQKPVAETLVVKGTRVNVTINKGFGMAKVVVPDCRGRQLSRSLALLKKAGLNLGKVIWSVSDSPAGEVISQSPPSGADVTNDSEVELEVSIGNSGRRAMVRHKLEVFLPAGSEPSKVRVMLLTADGEEEVYNASHVMGDVLSLWVAGPSGSDAEVYVNDKLFIRDKL
ncbi:MAG: PASTA domain-containing protein [bacterium]|nr:PASTA domain-containing protein [bacterium]